MIGVPYEPQLVRRERQIQMNIAHNVLLLNSTLSFRLPKHLTILVLISKPYHWISLAFSQIPLECNASFNIQKTTKEQTIEHAVNFWHLEASHQ